MSVWYRDLSCRDAQASCLDCGSKWVPSSELAYLGVLVKIGENSRRLTYLRAVREKHWVTIPGLSLRKLFRRGLTVVSE